MTVKNAIFAHFCTAIFAHFGSPLTSYIIAINVAPHAGAWIETLIYQKQYGKETVAPHAGAWIETCIVYNDYKLL